MAPFKGERIDSSDVRGWCTRGAASIPYLNSQISHFVSGPIVGSRHMHWNDLVGVDGEAFLVSSKPPLYPNRAYSRLPQKEGYGIGGITCDDVWRNWVVAFYGRPADCLS